jgi:hypothetical protein
MRKDRSLWFGACAILGAIWLAFCVAAQAADSPAAAQDPARVNVLAVHGVISPATSDFVTRGLRDAAQQGVAEAGRGGVAARRDVAIRGGRHIGVVSSRDPALRHDYFAHAKGNFAR